MAVLVDIDLELLNKYYNHSVSAKWNGKKHRVYFKLICDDFTLGRGIELSRLSSNVLFIEYRGTHGDVYKNLTRDNGVWIISTFRMGCDITDVDIVEVLGDTPLGVVPVIYLPNDFCDLEKVYRFCQKFDRVRFSGGNLFRCDGVRLGCYGMDLLWKRNVKVILEEYRTSVRPELLDHVVLSDLSLTVSETKAKKSSCKEKSNEGIKKEKKQLFSQFLGNNIEF